MQGTESGNRTDYDGVNVFAVRSNEKNIENIDKRLLTEPMHS